MPTRHRNALGWFADQPYVLLSLTALFWGGNVVIGRAVAGHVPPIALAQMRWGLAFLLVLPFAWRYLRRDAGAIVRHWKILAVLSFTGIAVYNTLSYIGLQHTTAINGLLIQSAMPLMIGFWSLVLFRDRLTLWQLAGITTSLVGVATIVLRGDLEALASFALNPGDLVMLVGVVVYAFYSALLKRRPPMHPLSFLAATLGVGAAMLVPAFLWEMSTGFVMTGDLATIAAVVYVALFASVIAYLFFNRGIELIGPNRAGPFFHLVPVFGSALAILLLGERPHWYHGVGYAMILSGIALAQLGRRRRPDGG